MTLNSNSLDICQTGGAQTTGPLTQLFGIPRVGDTAPITQLT